jgi:hypothetical protein
LDLVKGISLEAELDPQTEPFLKDHAMNGIPVLPGVMGIEGFSVAATHVVSVLGSSKAGFQVTKMEDVRFLAPFKFYRNEPRRITWHAQVVKETGGLVAHITLESILALKTRPNERMQHFSGRVFLRPLPLPESGDLRRVNPPHWNGAYTVDSETIYRLYFHGPAFQVLDGVQRSGDHILGRLARNLPSMTSREHPMLSAPVLIELCLQTAGIWEIGATGVLSLPSSIERLDIYESHIHGVPIYAEVNPIPDSANRLSFDARVVDAEGRLYLELKNYRTSPLPYKIEDALVQPLRELIKERE